MSLPVTDAVTIALSSGALVLSVVSFSWQRRHSDFELARALHQDLTTGPVAEARSVLGTLVHDPARVQDHDIPRARDAYFTLLWCFERLNAGRAAIVSGGIAARRPLKFLDTLVRWQVEYWAGNLPDVVKELERRLGHPLSDSRSRQGFEDLKRAMLTVTA